MHCNAPAQHGSPTAPTIQWPGLVQRALVGEGERLQYDALKEVLKEAWRKVCGTATCGMVGRGEAAHQQREQQGRQHNAHDQNV